MPFVTNDLVFQCGHCNNHPQKNRSNISENQEKSIEHCGECGTLIITDKIAKTVSFLQPNYLPPLVSYHHPRRGIPNELKKTPTAQMDPTESLEQG
jgi:hypothetical protein